MVTRRQTNDNMIRNGDLDNSPPFTAATTTSLRWIDGTAAGSTVDKGYYWGVVTSAGGSAMFDTSELYQGYTSLKLSTSASGGGFTECTNYANQPNVTEQVKWAIPVSPSTSYTFTVRLKTNYVSGDSTGTRLDIIEHTGDNTTAVATKAAITAIKVSQDWTAYTYTWTTAATTRLVRIKPLIYGHQGAATLVMDAWYARFRLVPTTAVTRSSV